MKPLLKTVFATKYCYKGGRCHGKNPLPSQTKNVYYFRLVVPAELRDSLKVREIIKSLKTENRAEAIPLALKPAGNIKTGSIQRFCIQPLDCDVIPTIGRNLKRRTIHWVLKVPRYAWNDNYPDNGGGNAA